MKQHKILRNVTIELKVDLNMKASTSKDSNITFTKIHICSSILMAY